MGRGGRLADDVVAAIRDAAADPILRARVAELYVRLNAEIAAAAPVCTNRGACCKFDTYGHLLFVTPAELAFFIAASPAAETRSDQSPPGVAAAKGLLQVLPPDAGRTTPDAAVSAARERSCPYQVGGLCTARERRPLGCRVFFCDPDAQEWQPLAYERYLTELKQIGAEAGLPYQYVEWLSALQQVEGLSVAEAGPA